MKSTLNRESEYGYPKLMESIENKGLIVMFYAYESGVVIATSTQTVKIGYHSTGWRTIAFKPYNGSVVLENKS